MPNMIYVLGIDGVPQMPTTRMRYVKKLLNTGKARIVEKVPFTIQLKYENDAITQPLLVAEDPGRTNIGVNVLKQNGESVFVGVVETRNKEIKKLMSDRKKHRHASRRGERKVRQRLAKKHGTMVKSGMLMRKLPKYDVDKFISCKFIKNTEARFCNRKRKPDWLTPTVSHLVETHINIVKKISKFLPITDVAIEVNKFAFLQMENPKASGVDFQNGPLKGYDDAKSALRDMQNNKCFMCKNDITDYHHIVPRSKGGSDNIKNLVGLCPECHKKIHTIPEFREKLEIKKVGILKEYGALSALNQTIPFICKKLLTIYDKDHVHFCTGKDTSMIRTSLGYEKTKTNQMHEIDAYCIGLCFTGISDIIQKFEQVYQIKQFRRQDRSLIKYQRERTYYLNGIKIATNRKPRFEQKGDELSDWYEKQVKVVGKKQADRLLSKVTVKKSTRSYNDTKHLMPGTVFYYNGERHVMYGQLTNGKYLRADTKYNYPAKDCKVVKSNGLVFL